MRRASPARSPPRWTAPATRSSTPPARGPPGSHPPPPPPPRHYGHPDLIGFVGDLGRAAAAARLGTVAVGDMAQPRGGPMSSGHVSHQGGLDVDVWFRLDVPPLPP